MELGKVVIFLHIPKTAGTTLNSILDREYGKKATFIIDVDNPGKSIAELARMPNESRRRILLLRNWHIPFGVHQHIPSPSTYITVLREPVNRLVSHYYHVSRTKDHYLHELVTSRRMSLHDYVTSGISTELDNDQTRMLAGAGDSIPFGQCAESLLTEAIDNIDRYFSFAGVTEYFDESLIHMHGILGWRKRPLYVRENRSKNKPPLMAIPDRTIAAIKQHNELDCRLYEHVKSQLEGTRSPAVIREIKKFQSFNLLYRMKRRFVKL